MIIAKYKNGNAVIMLYEDGTRVIETEDINFSFDFPCNMDIKISNYCEIGCPMCHENSNINGKHAPLENFNFIDSWNNGVEAAIGGGMVTSYPHLDKLLNKFKSKGIVVNATFHQNELTSNFDMIKKYQDEGLIWGIGVSYTKYSEDLASCIKKLNNVVFHLIDGFVDFEILHELSVEFNRPKILILGYKQFRRGNELYKSIGDKINEKITVLSRNIDWLFESFKVVSFDNLALEQLNVKSWLSNEQWNEFYQGDEGSNNMYIDAVEGKYACNSTSDIRYDLTDNVREMFKKIKEN